MRTIVNAPPPNRLRYRLGDAAGMCRCNGGFGAHWRKVPDIQGGLVGSGTAPAGELMKASVDTGFIGCQEAFQEFAIIENRSRLRSGRRTALLHVTARVRLRNGAGLFSCYRSAASLQHGQRDPDLAGLRDEAALAKLPEAERAAGRKLWAEVESVLQKAREQARLKEEEKPMPRADR